MNPARSGYLSCLLAAWATGHYATVEPGHPAFVVPHHIAEGTAEGSELPEHPHRASAASPPALAASSVAWRSTPPDPEPLSLAEQWEYQLLFQNGAPSVESVTKRTLQKPIPTPRRMGRFALELWIGRELIDRVRFDFPLLAAEERPGISRRPLHDSPSLDAHAIARVRVSLPASPRATRLLLIDRATEKSHELPWPPDAPAALSGTGTPETAGTARP